MNDATARFFDDAEQETARARAKFPGRSVMLAALQEEVGELAKAMMEESPDRVRAEAVQVAAMAARCAVDGDEALDAYRAARGLEPIGALGSVFDRQHELYAALSAINKTPGICSHQLFQAVGKPDKHGYAMMKALEERGLIDLTPHPNLNSPLTSITAAITHTGRAALKGGVQ